MAYLTISTGDITSEQRSLIFKPHDSTMLSVKESLIIRNRIQEILEEDEHEEEE